MPAKSRRRPQKRRQVKKRPRWVVRIILMAALLFAVFCATTLATLWFAQSTRSPGPAGVAPDSEEITNEEREALDEVLRQQKPQP